MLGYSLPSVADFLILVTSTRDYGRKSKGRFWMNMDPIVFNGSFAYSGTTGPELQLQDFYFVLKYVILYI